MSVSRPRGSHAGQSRSVGDRSSDIPVLFRMPMISMGASQKSPANASLHSAHDDFPPPPFEKIKSPARDETPDSRSKPTSTLAATESRTRERAGSGAVQNENESNTSEGWGAFLAPKLLILLVLAAFVGTIWFIVAGDRSDDLRLANDETDRLLAELGLELGQESLGAEGDAPDDSLNANPNSDLPASPLQAAASDSVELADAIADQDSESEPLMVAESDRKESSTEEADTKVADAPANSFAARPAMEQPRAFEKDASPTMDEDELRVADNFSPDPAISEPVTIREPEGMVDFGLTSPQSPYDTVSDGDSDIGTEPMTGETQRSANLGHAIGPLFQSQAEPPGRTDPEVAGSDFSPTDSQIAVQHPSTQTPHAINDWSRYFPVHQNPNVASATSQSGGYPVAEAVVPPGGTPAYQAPYSDPRIATNPNGPVGHPQDWTNPMPTNMPPTASSTNGYGFANPSPTSTASPATENIPQQHGYPTPQYQQYSVPFSPYDSRQ